MARNIRSAESADHLSPYGRSFTASSPIAASAIARDLAQYEDDDSTTGGENSESSTLRPASSHAGNNPHSLAGSYRRPSYFTNVNHATTLPAAGDYQPLTDGERRQAIEEERALLGDNHVIPDDQKPPGLQHKISNLFATSPGQGPSRPFAAGRECPTRKPGASDEPTESTALLGAANDDRGMGPEEIDRKWEEAVTAGLINTTWKREAIVLGQYSAPLMVTFLLQYSLTLASVFTIGHLGKEELGAVSLASMTVSITGNAVYSGLATSLDTLCAQAYGSGKRKLVGLQMLRMVYFLWLVTIPIAVLWFFSENILVKIVPETEVAQMAGLYLKIALLGTPGYACFESGKRYLQAQGVFSASLYVLLICAPFNAFLNWFLVWVSHILRLRKSKVFANTRN